MISPAPPNQSHSGQPTSSGPSNRLWCRLGRCTDLWRSRFSLHQTLASGGVGASIAHCFAAAGRPRVVFGSPVVGVEELFEPLQKLEIILKPALNQFVDRHYLEWG